MRGGGEWTYTGGRGNSVIDYVLWNEDTRERVERMEVAERVESDHHPAVVWLLGSAGRGWEGEKRGRGSARGNWTEMGREEFVRIFGKRDGGGRGIQEEWKELRDRIKGAIKEVGQGGERRERRGWWDKECKEEKGKLRRELRRWRREGGDGKEYRIKKEYALLCEGKKRKEMEKWEKEVEEVRTEGQVWKIVNRDRRRRKRVEEGIKMEEWEEYFRGILGGVEWRVRRGGERRRGRTRRGS